MAERTNDRTSALDSPSRIRSIESARSLTEACAVRPSSCCQHQDINLKWRRQLLMYKKLSCHRETARRSVSFENVLAYEICTGDFLLNIVCLTVNMHSTSQELVVLTSSYEVQSKFSNHSKTAFYDRNGSRGNRIQILVLLASSYPKSGINYCNWQTRSSETGGLFNTSSAMGLMFWKLT